MMVTNLKQMVKTRQFDQVHFMLTQLTKPQLQVLLFARKL